MSRPGRHRFSAPHQRILLALVALLGAWSAPATAQLGGSPLLPDAPMRVTVDGTTFFDNDPGWLLGVRPGVGFSADGTFANLGLAFGKVSARHLYIGGVVSARVDAAPWIRVGLRTGMLYRRRWLDLAMGTNLGLLYDLRSARAGVVPQLWTELRVRVSHRNFLTVFGELDARHTYLGFDHNETIGTVGVGWSVLF